MINVLFCADATGNDVNRTDQDALQTEMAQNHATLLSQNTQQVEVAESHITETSQDIPEIETAEIHAILLSQNTQQFEMAQNHVAQTSQNTQQIEMAQSDITQVSQNTSQVETAQIHAIPLSQNTRQFETAQNRVPQTSQNTGQIETAQSHTTFLSQNNQQTDLAQSHVAPSFAMEATAANMAHIEDRDEDDGRVAMRGSPRLSEGPVRQNMPDYDDDSGFPSPPVFAVNDRHNSNGVEDSLIDTLAVCESVPTEAIAPDDVQPVVPAPPPPPPPPAPPLPTTLNTATPTVMLASKPTQQSRGASTQHHLEEMRRRDATHKELLAAVAHRKQLLDSTDGEQVARSIESKVQRQSKLQMVYRAGSGVTERRVSSPAPMSSYGQYGGGLHTHAGRPNQHAAVDSGKYSSVSTA